MAGNKAAITRMLTTAIAMGLGLVSLPSGAVSFAVRLDTSSLSGLHSIALDFFDGDASRNNIVALGNFGFGGGGPSGLPTYNCTSGSGAACTGISGSLLSSVILSDSRDFFNEVVADFMPGASLSFTLDFTTNFAGGTPDSFLLSLLDGSGNPLGTADPLGTDTFLSIDIAPTVSMDVYASPGNGIPAPAITPVPEPGGLPLSLMGLGVLAYVLRRNQCRELTNGL